MPERNVSVQAHEKSWVAGVLDGALRVRVDRTFHPRAMRMRAYVLADRTTCEELRDVLGAGVVERASKQRWHLKLRNDEITQVWYEYGPFMRGGGRDRLRIAASWASLPPARGDVTEQVLDMRVKLVNELFELDGQQEAEGDA